HVAGTAPIGEAPVGEMIAVDRPPFDHGNPIVPPVARDASHQFGDRLVGAFEDLREMPLGEDQRAAHPQSGIALGRTIDDPVYLSRLSGQVEPALADIY